MCGGIWDGLYWVLVLYCSPLCSFWFCNHLAEEEFLLSCDCQCLVSLPRGAVGWSVIVALPDQSHLLSENKTPFIGINCVYIVSPPPPPPPVSTVAQ